MARAEERRTGDGRPRLRPAVSAAVLLTVTFAVVLDRLWAVPAAAVAAGYGVLAYLVLEAGSLGWGAWLTLAAAAIVAVVAVIADAPGHLLTDAIGRAALLTALLASLAFLQEAARSSPLLVRSGRSLMARGAGLRYLVVTVGAHLAAVVLNFGVVPLFGTAIRHGADGPSAALSADQRRLVLALLRGFAAMTAWSPLSLSFAVALAAVDDLAWERLVPAGLLTAILLLALGVLYDRVAGDSDGDPPVTGTRPPWRPVAEIFLLVAGVVAAVIGATLLLGSSPILAVIVTSPFVGAAWVAFQNRGSGPRAAVGRATRRLGGRAAQLPLYRQEIAILGGASFIGVVLAEVVPASAVAAILDQLSLPSAALAALAAWTIVLAGLFGLSPLVSVTVLGAALSGNIDPVLLGVALMAGWALTVGSSPVGAGILTLGKLIGVRAGVLGRRWNGAYTALGAAMLGPWLLIIERLIEAGLL